MTRDRQEMLRRIEDRLTEVSAWLAAERVVCEQRLEQLRAAVESARRDLRTSAAESMHDALGRAGAAVGDMERDFQIPPPHATFPREEIQALSRHLRLTATLLPHLSNLDDPGGRRAHEDHERSWYELHRAFETPGVETRRCHSRRRHATVNGSAALAR